MRISNSLKYKYIVMLVAILSMKLIILTPNPLLAVETKVNTYTIGDQIYPVIVRSSSGNFVIVWVGLVQDGGSAYEVYAQRYDKSGNTLGNEFKVNTEISAEKRKLSAAMDSSGNFLIAWLYMYPENPWDKFIKVQRYDKDCSPVGNEFQVIGGQYISSPSVAMDAIGNFVITWSNSGIFAQRYNSSGNPIGSKFQVSDNTNTIGGNPIVLMDASDNFVIVWTNYGQDGHPDVYAKRYNNNGVPYGGEFKVNTYTTGYQYVPAAAMNANGDLVIVWESLDQDGSSYGIYAQQYDNSGSPVGSEFRVNTYTVNAQANPSVGIDNSGNFVITWDSDVQDGINTGIYAQRYNKSGIPIGSEFLVNTYVVDYQKYPSVSTISNDNFVVAWQSNWQDGSGYGIYMDQFSFSTQQINKPPIANAGNNQTVNVGTQVTLNGSGSTDYDGDIITYSWAQVSGANITLSNLNFATPTFTPNSAGIYEFQLIVNDGKANSAPDNVIITVNGITNQIPLANAGNDQTVNTGTQVALNGSGSSDADSDVMTYSWTQVSGTNVTLTNPNSATPTFIPNFAGTYEFQLIVNDGKVNSNSDNVIITVNELPNNIPIANAGSDQTLNVGTQVTLNGSGSSDADSDVLIYSWAQVSGTNVTL
ncbi:MAG: hypothetical protein HY738_18380, partial [Bacteroidia bacterium]|nr:hypothetical protein [Bacteroidia bacterium]